MPSECTRSLRDLDAQPIFLDRYTFPSQQPVNSNASSAEFWSTAASSTSGSSKQEGEKHHCIWGRIESFDCCSDTSAFSPSLPDLSDVCFEDESGSDTDSDTPYTEQDEIKPTTLMLRNLPSRLTKEELRDEMLKCGAQAGLMAFLYMPVKPDGLSRGFAFVGFKKSEQAAEFWNCFEGHVFGSRKSTKRVEINVACLQGIRQVLAEYPSLQGNDGFLRFDSPLDH